MLDSSPVALPPIPRPLKRSASTASLPTPPRSYRKLARGKSRGSCDSDSDENVVSDDDDEPLRNKHKKRRIGEEKQEDDEDTFWLGTPAAATTNLTPKNQPALKSNNASSTTTTLGSTASPPMTPKTQSSAEPSTRRALRDSPDNPFLADDYSSNKYYSANSSANEPFQERPTITYVFRGVQRVCKNPLYNHAQDRPFSPPPESKLDIEHPDYSPSIHCIPTRLFSDILPEKRIKHRIARARVRSPRWFGKDENYDDDDYDDEHEEEEEEDEDEIRPLKLDFGSGKKKKAGSGSSLDQE